MQRNRSKLEQGAYTEWVEIRNMVKMAHVPFENSIVVKRMDTDASQSLH